MGGRSSHQCFTQLHPSFLFLPPTSYSTSTSSSSSSSSSSLSQEMEYVEAALKSSLRREAASLLPLSEEFCGGLGVGPCEDFLVDELLDFSNGDGLVEEEEDVEKKFCEQKDGGTGVLCGVLPAGDSTVKDELAVAQSGGELSVPAEDSADLEWLSHFVEESFSGFLSPFPAGVLPDASWAAKEKEGAKPEVSKSEDRVFNTPVHARARRSHRSRMSGSKGWSPSLSETSSSSSSSSSSPCITSDTDVVLAEPPAKKRRNWGSHGSGTGQVAARRCSHCGVQKTPQWRAGPLGSKTLCNACGVRFKSGRLFPEYRPACSPTFLSELHSNHHRKVLEMRRKNESSSPSLLSRPEPGLAVLNF
ncbi:hypothetical protein MLD38_007795 [Melastoma candidum]|uniref:Uncharacterized protein n=1 Tax=Melastoma candidum TaxID=119954 RepID=A0ACB9RRV8_9MYRT|nr:hypothetical protein MLD38_007795 [Melastoma candidum]